ncbi:MAG: hypothetical protein CMM10_01960 [Rhodospirillaceae bacterium]|nr:hypothetical protein [Rhodospirillaceae bacterium]
MGARRRRQTGARGMNANRITRPATRKGVIPRLFGVVLIFVGILDAMLSWRAAVAVENFYLILVALGLVFYVIGGIRRRQDANEPTV